MPILLLLLLRLLLERLFVTVMPLVVVVVQQGCFGIARTVVLVRNRKGPRREPPGLILGSGVLPDELRAVGKVKGEG